MKCEQMILKETTKYTISTKYNNNWQGLRSYDRTVLFSVKYKLIDSKL